MQSRAYLINGDIYYSPNCSQDVQLPGELIVDDIAYFNNVGVEKFEEPYWWLDKVPWLGFVPRWPVCWNGAVVEDLGQMTLGLVFDADSSTYRLPNICQNRFLAVETLIREVLRIFSQRFNIQYLEPYSTRKWGYTNQHSTIEETWRYARQGRDWFAMWIAALYWMIKVVPENEKYREAITPSEWFLVLLTWDKSRISVWEALRTAPLLNRFWDCNRSGVFLHNPDDVPTQPWPRWFKHLGVPVWYRWGAREIAQHKRNNNFSLMVPPLEILQAATTIITTAVPSYNADIGNEWDYAQENAQENNYQFSPTSPDPIPPANSFSPPASPPPSSPSQVNKLVWKNG